MRMNGKWTAAILAAWAGSGIVRAQDTFKAPNCPDVTQANFTKVTVLDKTKDPTLDEVTRFAVAKDGSIYFSERGGAIKMVSADGSKVTKLGKINSYPTTSPLHKKINNINNEFGLVGFTIDPDFETNHWIYVDYQSATVDSSHLSRFTVTGNALDMSSEKVILAWPTQKNYCCHTGGDIRIDGKGDLWISVGNNSLNPGMGSGVGEADSLAYIDTRYQDADDEGHAANSNDLRGKILRIHPTPDGKYTIPAGNFRDYFASMYSPQEQATIRPEIYTMGHRNPYTIAVDDLNGLLVWGEVGPDMGWVTEELNLVSHPGFMGWPYFAGAVGNPHYQYHSKPVKDPAAPANTGINNTGVKKLPPAQGAIYGYSQAAAVTGPIYRYNPAQTSLKKLPGHFDGMWFATDWKNGSAIMAQTLNADNTQIVSRAKFFTGSGSGFVHPLEVYIAPDGVMYVLDYLNLYNFTTDGSMPAPFSSSPPRIYRLEYTGQTCAPAVSLRNDQASRFQKSKNGLIHLGWGAERQIEVPLGYRGFALYDLQGKLVWSGRAAERNDAYSQFLPVPASVGAGLFKVQYTL